MFRYFPQHDSTYHHHYHWFYYANRFLSSFIWSSLNSEHYSFFFTEEPVRVVEFSADVAWGKKSRNSCQSKLLFGVDNILLDVFYFTFRGCAGEFIIPKTFLVFLLCSADGVIILSVVSLCNGVVLSWAIVDWNTGKGDDAGKTDLLCRMWKIYTRRMVIFRGWYISNSGL